MPAPDPELQDRPIRLHGLRVVAMPQALDAAQWRPEGIVLRVAIDEALAIGCTDVEITDPYAIVEPESAFVGWWLTNEQFAACVEPRLEWPLPQQRPALAQGLVAGVPLKLWLEPDRVLVITSSGLAHEAAARLFAASLFRARS